MHADICEHDVTVLYPMPGMRFCEGLLRLEPLIAKNMMKGSGKSRQSLLDEDMAESRTRNATRNAIFALLLKLYQIIMPFGIRTIFIHTLGMQYIGLNGLFTSILDTLNLVELGVGSALIFSMYKPIAERNIEMICSLMNFYKKSYRIIGLVVTGLGIGFMPFLNIFIKSSLPAGINIYVLYLINLAGTVSTYFLFAYKHCLFVAHQRNDVTSKITLAVETIKYILQLFALVFFRNYYFYVVIVPVCGITTNIIIAVLAGRYYPEYKSKGKLSKEYLNVLTKKIMALFVVKIGSVVLNSSDNIVISAFLGLTVLGQYSNYYYVVSSVISIIGLCMSSIIASLGNSIEVETREKNYRDFLRLSFWNQWIVGWFAICLVCLSQHFIRLWLGEESMLPFGIVILLAVYFYILQSNQVAGAYKDAAGIWVSDRFRPLATAGVNLISNLIMVQFIGIYGIVLSTVISLLVVNTPWLLYNVCKLVFGVGIEKYISYWICNTIVTILAGGISFCVCNLLPETGIWWLLGKGVICVFIPNLIYFVVYHRTKRFIDSKEIVRKIYRSTLHR